MLRLTQDIAEDPNLFANWIELYLILQNDFLSKSSLIKLLDDNAISNAEEYVDSALIEIEYRNSLCNGYLFDLKSNTVRSKISKSKYPEYILCLFFSVYGDIMRDNGTKLFEQIVEQCVKTYLVNETILLGFPNPKSYVQNIENFCACFKEKLGREMIARKYTKLPESQMYKHIKDNGVDIIGIKSFHDKHARSNHLYILIQCGAGKDWCNKRNIPMQIWKDFITWNNDTVIPSMAIPHIVKLEEWEKFKNIYGIIIDRIRLFNMMKSNDYYIPTSIKNRIAAWNDNAISTVLQ